MVPPALLAVQETLALPAVQAKLALQARLATQARTAHPALAITAHRLVWLQVIKRRRSTFRAHEHRPDRSLSVNEKKDHFVKSIFASFYPLLHLHPGYLNFLS
jgi:hypothetical protein